MGAWIEENEKCEYEFLLEKTKPTRDVPGGYGEQR